MSANLIRPAMAERLSQSSYKSSNLAADKETEETTEEKNPIDIIIDLSEQQIRTHEEIEKTKSRALDPF